MALNLSRYGLFLEETSVAGDPQGCGKVEQCRSNCRDATVEPTWRYLRRFPEEMTCVGRSTGRRL